jgi:ribosome biogenesis GTPase / thiamine phosphate phosphatase
MSTTTHSNNDSPITGIVYKKNSGQYHVQSNGNVIACSLSTRLRKNSDGLPGDLVAVGDEVHFLPLDSANGVIVEILPRRSKLARRSAVPMPGAHAFEQVIVANVDQVVPVFAAADPPPKWNMLDRYLVSAEAAEIPALICITKLDLVKNGKNISENELDSALDAYRRIGYPVITVSAYTGEGLDEMKTALQGRFSVLVGKSGVGKSSLLNAIQPGLGLRVNQVNAVTGKGRHTTTNLEMFTLQTGGAIVDTPGVREFGLWDVDSDDLALFFPEMRLLVGRCRFGLDCRHDEEPGCAIRTAVMDGQIDPRRYKSYIRLQEEV